MRVIRSLLNRRRVISFSEQKEREREGGRATLYIMSIEIQIRSVLFFRMKNTLQEWGKKVIEIGKK